MSAAPQGLSPSEARAFYDGFGRKQDSQGFYEDAALEELLAHAGFERAGRVFEFGCGTGKLAARLFAERLPAHASYVGVDISPVMLGIAGERLVPYASRATLLPAGDDLHFPVAEHSVDRVVSSYVVDLLGEKEIGVFFEEAWRVLEPGGLLCLAGLTEGDTLVSGLVSRLWLAAFRMRPSLVGGCRPVRLDRWIQDRRWKVQHRAIRTPFGVPSEALVLEALPAPRPQR